MNNIRYEASRPHWFRGVGAGLSQSSSEHSPRVAALGKPPDPFKSAATAEGQPGGTNEPVNRSKTMAKAKQKKFDAVKANAAARRKAYFANGGTAKGWSLLNGAGLHGTNKSKAARNKRACRGRVR